MIRVRDEHEHSALVVMERPTGDALATTSIVGKPANEIERPVVEIVIDALDPSVLIRIITDARGESG